MSEMIDDDFLYAHMPQFEENMLNKIPLESELSYEFSKRFNRKMNALLKYERRTPAMRVFVRQMKNAVAVFIIVLSITFGTAMSVEAYRIRFFEFVSTVWQELTSVITHSNDNADHDVLVPVVPTYIPDGFSVLEQQSSEYTHTIVYSNAQGTEIYYTQKLATQGELIIDSEDIDINTIVIESQKVYTLINKGTVQIYWHDGFNIFSLVSSFDEIELLKVAENIIKK